MKPRLLAHPILIGLFIMQGVFAALAAFPGAAAVPDVFTVNFVRQWSVSGAAHTVAFNPVNARVYVIDEPNRRIQYFDSAGNYQGQWGGVWGHGNGEFVQPVSLAFNAAGDRVYVVDREDARVQYFSSLGSYLGQWGSPGSGDGQFQKPAAIAQAPDGSLYIADRENHRIQHFSDTGQFLGKFGQPGSGNGQLNAPMGVAVAANHTIYVADAGNHRVQYFDAQGSYLGQWGSSGSGNGQFNGNEGPSGLQVDSSGNVYVADPGNNLVQVFSASGAFLGQWGGWGASPTPGKFYFPNGVALASGQQVYVADELNNRIQQFTVDVGAVTPPALPGAFSKTTPGDGGSGAETAVGLSWGTSSGATSYEYCYDVTNDSLCGGNWVSAGLNTGATTGDLAPNITYYWQARARNAEGVTYADQGSWWRFTRVTTGVTWKLAYLPVVQQTGQ